MQTAIYGKVFGKVQGVFFRDSTYKKAQELDIKGFVRNLPDGSVEVEFEGEDRAVRKMILFLKEGSTIARVDKFQYNKIEPQGYEDFKIL
jgi:acylphosphatase